MENANAKIAVYPMCSHFRAFDEMGPFRNRKRRGPAPYTEAVNAREHNADATLNGIISLPYFTRKTERIRLTIFFITRRWYRARFSKYSGSLYIPMEARPRGENG